MLFEFFILGFIVAVVLIGFGWYALINEANNKGNLFLIAGALVLLLTGIFAVVDPVGLESTADCMNASYENSYVWNDTCHVYILDMGANPLTIELVDAVNVTNYGLIVGTFANTYTHNTVVYEVDEQVGGGFNITWNWTGLPASGYDATFWGYYEGNPAHTVSCEIYNFSSAGFQDCDADPSNDFPTSAVEYLREFDFEDDDYYSAGVLGGTLIMRMTHSAASTGGHYMYTDQLILNHIEYFNNLTYEPCTRDQYNITYTYGPCGTTTMDFQFSQMIAIMMMLAGVGTMLGTIGWNKYGKLDDEDAFYSNTI